MSNIIRLSFLNSRNIVKTKGFILSLASAVIYVLLWLYMKPGSYSDIDYQFEFFRVINFIILYFSCAALGKEFVYGTSKILFTATLSRTSVIIQKLLMLLQIGMLYWLCSRILEIAITYRISEKLDLNSIFNINTLNSLVIFLVISFVLGSFCLMLSAIVFNFNIVLVAAIGYFGALQFFVPLLYGLRDKTDLTIAERIVASTPNYIIFSWVEFWNIRPVEFILMMFWGCVFLTISIAAINKRNIK